MNGVEELMKTSFYLAMEILQGLQVVHISRLTHLWQKKIDALLNDGKSTDQIYTKLSKENFCTVSETITL